MDPDASGTMSALRGAAGPNPAFNAFLNGITLGRSLPGTLTEAALQGALAESQQRQAEISFLLEGCRAVLEHDQFESAARAILDSCRFVQEMVSE